MEKLGILEGILFVVGNEGISASELMDILELKEDNINYLIDKLKEKYLSEESGLNIEYLGGKYKLTTKKELDKQFDLCCEYIINYIKSIY